MSLSRNDRSLLTRWWLTVDQTLLAAILTLFTVGVIVSLAASPSVAAAKGLGLFHFVERHLIHAAAGVLLMLAISFLQPRGIRRLALIMFLISVLAMVAAVLVGPEWNGAHRWLPLGPITVQPSEFAKPAFVVLSAWALSEYRIRSDMPALPIAIGLAALLIGVLLWQPDLGQTMLVTATWGALLILAGLPLIWPALVALLGVVLLASAYLTLEYVRRRVDTFLSGDFADGGQTARALGAFTEGGFWGRGPGEGTIKSVLPDAHTDFIFAVIAEEYGIIACLALLVVYAIIAGRLVRGAIAEGDLSIRFALIGLAVVFSLQALINMAVNVALLPATGMTLPLISAGGSSILAISATLGMGLALSRRRPQSARLKRQAMAATPAAGAAG